MESPGIYTADRAAALSGVPKSTIHYWARKGHLVPSASPVKVRLWSFTDLLALRVIYWLRKPKDAEEATALPHEIPATSMPKVREALESLKRLDLDLFDSEHRPAVGVTLDGEVVICPPGETPSRPDGQYLAPGLINVVAPFPTERDVKGPDLYAPRPAVRIQPARLGGEPFIKGTRIETRSIYALSRTGRSVNEVVELYPFLSRRQVRDSIDLERQLERNLAKAA